MPHHGRVWWWGAALLVATWAPPADAQTLWTGDPEGRDPAAGAPAADVQCPLWVDHRLSLRFRPELIVGGDLGTPRSAVPPPLESLALSGGRDADSLAWASIRLRYEPTLHLGPTLRIHAGLDALDNLVLGSTHVNMGGDFADGLWDDAQAPPTPYRANWRDSLRVRQLYGSWNVLNALDVSFGRMPDHFGLGMVRNAGDCLDCDHGSIVDAVRVGLTVYGLRLEGTWEFAATGATTERPGFEGQPKDLGQADDVTTYTLRLERRPVTPAALADRERMLNERRAVAFDFGLFSAFTTQDLSSQMQVGTAFGCEPFGTTATNVVALPWECWQLVPRDAFFWRPGAWVRLEQRPSAMTRWRVGVELGAIIGEMANTLAVVDDVPDLFERAGNNPKDFFGIGGVLESALELDGWALGLDAGFATGDDRPAFGFVDGQFVALADPDDVLVRTNADVTNFLFNRDYRVDLILFRQIIGGVTNAVYVKPWVSASLLRTEDTSLFARLDVLYAAALEPEGTPGKGRHYGIELDAQLGLEVDPGITASVTGGLFVPLDAFDDLETGAGPDPVFALRGILAWGF